MHRREFLLGLGASALAAAEPYDLLIKGGELRDPSQNLRRNADIAIRGDAIAAIEADIPRASARQVLDASGTMVTPGLVDLHTHCYYGATGLGIDPDPVGARSGATTWVDAGSFGYDQTEGFRRFIVNPAKVRVYGFVYLYPSSRNPDIDPVQYVRRGIKRTGETGVANRDIILGVKMQVGSNMNGRYSLEFLKAARELCDTYKLPLMAHISFAPPETEEVMALMRRGDIVTHALNGHTLGIVDKEGRIKPGVLEARQRGVIFDVGHGLGSFNFPAARKILDAGFVPDTISTDIYNLNVKGPVYDMPTTMSKMLHLGMSFDDVLLRSTAKPGQVVNRIPKLGTLQVGAPADVALLALESGEFPLVDSQKNQVTAKQRIVCRGTVCRGKVLQGRS
jgi:dihydroorotase